MCETWTAAESVHASSSFSRSSFSRSFHAPSTHGPEELAQRHSLRRKTASRGLPFLSVGGTERGRLELWRLVQMTRSHTIPYEKWSYLTRVPWGGLVRRQEPSCRRRRRGELSSTRLYTTHSVVKTTWLSRRKTPKLYDAKALLPTNWGKPMDAKLLTSARSLVFALNEGSTGLALFTVARKKSSRWGSFSTEPTLYHELSERSTQTQTHQRANVRISRSWASTLTLSLSTRAWSPR